jgi:hypothetical protein
LYQKVVDDLQKLLYAVGLRPHKTQCNENKIPVKLRITV